MNPCNPTDPVPVPREVAEHAKECAIYVRDVMSLEEGAEKDAAKSACTARALESALAAPPDDGWNRNLGEAPKDDYVLLAVTGTSKCTFFEPQSVCSWWDEVEEKWMSFPKGYHQRHQIIAWRPLPAPAKPKRHRGINAVPDDAWPKCPDGHLESGTAKPKPEVANG